MRRTSLPFLYSIQKTSYTWWYLGSLWESIECCRPSPQKNAQIHHYISCASPLRLRTPDLEHRGVYLPRSARHGSLMQQKEHGIWCQKTLRWLFSLWYVTDIQLWAYHVTFQISLLICNLVDNNFYLPLRVVVRIKWENVQEKRTLLLVNDFTDISY